MASATTTHHRGSHPILRLAAFLLLASASATVLAAGSSSACESEKFPAGRSYATCADLGALGATLHWTYDASTSSLSVAFSAKPPPGSAAGAGWVAWGVNTAGDGMKGAQSLVAFKSTGSSAYAVNTYNLTGYRPLGAASTPIDFKATGLAADASGADGKVRMYGVLQLPKGTEAVNHIWQVGAAVNNGAPAKHAFAKENLEAKGRLLLAGAGAPEAAPAPAAGGEAVEAAGSNGNVGTGKASPAPSGGKSSSSATACSTLAPAMSMLLALGGFLAIV